MSHSPCSKSTLHCGLPLPAEMTGGAQRHTRAFALAVPASWEILMCLANVLLSKRPLVNSFF